jgi:hypothetical protein
MVLMRTWQLAACNAFANSLRMESSVSTHNQIIRLPASLTSTEKMPFIVTGFNNLKTAIEHMSKEDEKSLLILLEELNSYTH